MSLPTVQKAIVASDHGPNYKLDVVSDYPVPTPSPSQVVVRLEYTGVCASDKSCLYAEWGFTPTCRVPGHEGVGRVVSLGSSVTGVDIGLKVGVPLISNPCFACEKCFGPDGETVCEKTNTSSEYGFYGETRDGTWQQYVVVESTYLIPVPEDCASETVGPVLCGGVTAYKGIKRSGLRAGQWVVIPGCGGGLGTMAIQFAKNAGLRVIGIDAGSKRELSCGLGAEYFIDYESEDILSRVYEITRIGAHGVIVLTPNEKMYNLAVDLLRENGTMICIGLPPDHVQLGVAIHSIVNKSLNIRGSFVGTRVDIVEALDMVARGVVTPSVQVFRMDEIESVLTLMKNGKLKGRAVLNLEYQS